MNTLDYLQLPDQEAKVYSADHDPVSLRSWLGGSCRPDDAHVVLIPFENCTIHEEKAALEQLSSRWEIPGLIMRGLITPIIEGSARKDTPSTSWSSHAITIPYSYRILHRAHIAIGFGKDGEKKSIRVVVACNWRLQSHVEQVLSAFFEVCGSTGSGELKATWFRALLLWQSGEQVERAGGRYLHGGE
ncbi:hypothetical protein IMZ48_20995 [Candidatus Bathyarchaeota archaeon]|nr:hypothetical protein [Candidatus Bathyarchaeota archaeon]